MHAESYYEKCLVDEYRRHRSGIPNWLKHENEVYEWILELGRCMRVPLREPKSSVSKKLLYRINNIETIRFGRYENISDELKGAVSMIKTELNSLGIDLRMDATLWKDKELLILSQKGLERWKKSYEVFTKARDVKPDTEWRHNLEKRVIASMLGIDGNVDYEEYEIVEYEYEDCDNDDEMIAEYCKLPLEVLEKMVDEEDKREREKLKKYEDICKKLGFEPCDYVFVPSGYDDDSKPNPFSVLSIEERLFLYNEGFLDVKKKSDSISLV